MSRGLADTSIFIARESGRALDEAKVPGVLAVSIITIGELRSGVLLAPDGASRSSRLASLTSALRLGALPVDEDVADAWADLRTRLVGAGKRMAVNDAWIAATALAHGLPVVTQDADYVGVEGLDVIRV